MKTHRIAYAAALTLILAAAFYSSATAAPADLPTLTITLTDEGIMVSPEERMGGQNYAVTIINNTAANRGVTLTGLDKGGSPFIRFTEVVASGHSDHFLWYFPAQGSVVVKDLLRCEHAMLTCWVAELGGLTSTILFG